MNTQINLERLAQLVDGKIWQKNGFTRIYLNDFKSTKKTEIKVWVEIENNSIYVNARVFCPSQSRTWNENYRNELLDLADSRLKSALNKIKEENQPTLTTKSEVFKYAWKLIKEQGLSKSAALKAAWALYKRG